LGFRYIACRAEWITQFSIARVMIREK